jgi:hypothetical protein
VFFAVRVPNRGRAARSDVLPLPLRAGTSDPHGTLLRLSFDPLSATAQLMRIGPEGGFSVFGGTCFGFRHPDYYLTAAHCVVDAGPREVLVSQSVPTSTGSTIRLAEVVETKRHDHADIAVLRVGDKAGAITAPFSGHLVSNHALGEDFMAYGYPESVYGPDKRRPTRRLFKGHYQRFFGHQSHLGYRYYAAELSVACPAGLSGGPLFRPGAHSVVVAMATENIESTTGADFEEEKDGGVTTVYRRVLAYGIAVMLEPLRDWLASAIPDPDSRAA